MSDSNYVADREISPQWVRFDNGRTVYIRKDEEGHPYLEVGWAQEGEARLRRLAAAEDDAGCVNIGDPVEAICANCGKHFREHVFEKNSDAVPANCWFPKIIADMLKMREDV